MENRQHGSTGGLGRAESLLPCTPTLCFKTYPCMQSAPRTHYPVVPPAPSAPPAHKCLPTHTLPMPAQTGSGTSDMNAALQRVAAGEATMTEAVGPAVGCLMATFGTNMISSCIFEFQDPEDLS